MRAVLLAIAVFVWGFTANARLLPYRPALSEWPAICNGRTYCDFKPSYYPEEVFKAFLDPEPTVVPGDFEHRFGEDVACSGKRSMRRIYLIKDDNDQIRFVAQTDKIIIKLIVEECSEPGRVEKATYLDHHILAQQRVECVEKMVPIMFPVLSLDGTRLDSVAPKGGIPLSCSAKIIEDLL